MAVTSGTRIGWAKLRECLDLLYRKKFSMKIKRIAYKSCVRSTMLHGSKAWSLGRDLAKNCVIVRNMCEVKLIDRKSTNDLMQMLDLNKTIDQLAKANSVRWYGHVLRKDKTNCLRRALDVRVKGTMKREMIRPTV